MAENSGVWNRGLITQAIDPNEKLFLFGYSCKIFRDNEKARYIDQGKHLIPWMGDESLMIDRYDVRGYLHDLKQYEPKPGGYSESLESEEEKLCEEERYRSLHSDLSDEQLYQEEELKRLRAAVASDGAYHEIGFSYENETERDSELMGPKVEEEDEPYEVPEGLIIPKGMETPSSMRIHIIIEKTAVFVSKQGGQMEIIIKMKQHANPQFAFMHLDNPLYPYYKHLVKEIKSEAYKPVQPKRISRSEDEDEDGHYLHPSLLSGKKDNVPKFTVPSINFRRSQDDSYSVLVRNLQQQLAEEKLAREQAQEDASKAAENQNLVNYSFNDTLGSEGQNSSFTDMVIPAPDVQPIIQKMAEYVAKNGEDFEYVVKSKNDKRFEFLQPSCQFYDYYIHLRDEAKQRFAVPPVLQNNVTVSSELSPNHESNASPPYESNASQPSESNASQPSESNASQPGESNTSQSCESNASQPSESNVSQPSESNTSQPCESNASQPYESNASQPYESNAPQPLDEPTVIKTETLISHSHNLHSPEPVTEPITAEFDTLCSQDSQDAVIGPEPEIFMEEQINTLDSGDSVLDSPKDSTVKPAKALKGPISFSLKVKESDTTPSEKIKIPLLLNDSDEDSNEETKEKNESSKKGRSAEESRTAPNSRHDSVEREEKSKLNSELEAKLAEERKKDKLLAAARERLVQHKKEKRLLMEQLKREEQLKKDKQLQIEQSRKDKQLQLERKKKAALFLKMLKKRDPESETIEAMLSADKKSKSERRDLWNHAANSGTAENGILFPGAKLHISTKDLSSAIPGLKTEWSSDSASELSGEEIMITEFCSNPDPTPELVPVPEKISEPVKHERKKKKKKRSRSRDRERRSKSSRSRDRRRSRSPRNHKHEKSKKEKELPAAYALKRSRSRSRSPRRYRQNPSYWNRRR